MTNKAENNQLYLKVKPEILSGQPSWFSYLYFLRRVLGPEVSRDILEVVKDPEQVVSTEIEAELDQKIFTRLAGLFTNLFSRDDLNTTHIIKHFFQLADETVNQLRELGFPGMEYTYGLLNTTSINSLSPIRNIKDILGLDREGGIADRASYELLRKMVLALLLMNLENLRDEFDLYEDLVKLADQIEDEVMEDPRGSGENKKLYVLHDVQTNQVLAVYESQEQAQVAQMQRLGSKIKVHVHRVRKMILGPDKINSPEVMYHFREKSSVRSLVKAIGEGSRTGTINFANGLSDELGLMIVAYGNRDQVFEQILEFIKSKYQFVELTDKTQLKTDNGQSSAINFKRVAVYLHGMSKPPVELVVYDIKDYLNAQDQVAVRNATGQIDYYQGPAHRLYEQRRTNLVADVIFPESIFPRDEDEQQRDYLFYMSLVARIFNS